jgi:pimeloyl-ACP methyl ester carboxylesterase
MPYLTLSDGTSIYYEDLGEGSPIVFVAGGGATHALWEQQVVALAGPFRTVTYDHRGCGASDTPREGYTIDRFADDLAELVERLSLVGTTFVSHGFGGHILLRALHRHPDIGDKAVLVAAAPWYVGDKDGVGGFSEEFLAALKSGAATNFAQSSWDIIENWLFQHDPGTPAKIAALVQAVSWSAYAHKHLSADMESVDHRPYLPRIRQEVLIVHGVHDRKNRYEGSEHLARLLPNARLVRFEDSAHAVFADELELFNRTVARFVSGDRGETAP